MSRYRSYAQWDLPPTTVLARTSLDAAGLVGAMQRELGAVNATVARKFALLVGVGMGAGLSFHGDRYRGVGEWKEIGLHSVRTWRSGGRYDAEREAG